MQIDRTKKTATPTGVSAAVLMITGSLFSGMTHATPTYLSKVNSYCGASYSCSQCHTNPPALNSTGKAFAQLGHDPASICPPTTSPTCTDSDGDGYAVEGGACGPVDCNDKQAAVNPGAVENCTNGKDDNCNGLIDTQDPTAVGCPTTPTCTDDDGDGYAFEGGACGPIDCDDSNPAVNPGALESCMNGTDDNCNGLIDAQDPTAVGCATTSTTSTTCTDADGDGYAIEGGGCGPVDSNDSNPAINPEATENCSNGIDDNGNGLIDGADPACAVCVPKSRVEKKKRACTDGADNDCNGLVDCADPSCSSTRSCKPARTKKRHHHEGDAGNSNENDTEQEQDGDND